MTEATSNLAIALGQVEAGAGDACILWTGPLDRYGYGNKIWCEPLGRRTRPHRVIYALLVGPIPDGLTVDHQCFNPPCVNPRHLELATRVANSRRQRSASKTHCANGHEFTPENTRIRTGTKAGRRACRACNLIDARRSKARRRKAKLAA